MPTPVEVNETNAFRGDGKVSELLVKDPLIRDSDGALMMGCSKATFWRRVADGTVPAAIKIGGTSRWRLSDIEAVIAKAEAERKDSAA